MISALDRTRWRPAHTRITAALGVAWMLDSFEVAIIGSVIPTVAQQWGLSDIQGLSLLAIWLVGILVGAQLVGVLADRFGRRRLFLITLLFYATFTFLTAFSVNYEMLMVLRFLTAIGVGAEYSAINSAISEFIPARHRGRANAFVMSSWGVGALLAAGVGAVVIGALPTEYGWRLGFAIGAVMALVALIARRALPESPRWLLRQGRVAEARRVIEAITGRSVKEEPEPASAFPEKASIPTLLRRAPRPAALGAALDFAEASGYYGLLYAFFPVVVAGAVGISPSEVPLYLLWSSFGVLAGGVMVALLIDRFPRANIVITTYLLAACGLGVLAVAAAAGSKGGVLVAFVLASASATAAWVSAYPTFTEAFPTELRGTGVGFSVAVGRVGAAVSALGIAGIAGAFSITAAFAVFAGMWVLGAIAMFVWRAGGGPEGAKAALEQLEPGFERRSS